MQVRFLTLCSFPISIPKLENSYFLHDLYVPPAGKARGLSQRVCVFHLEVHSLHPYESSNLFPVEFLKNPW